MIKHEAAKINSTHKIDEFQFLEKIIIINIINQELN